MFSNSVNGKTSAGKTVGTFLVLVGATMMLYATFFVRDVAILNAILFSASGSFAAGSGLILGKIISPTKVQKEIEPKQYADSQ